MRAHEVDDNTHYLRNRCPAIKPPPPAPTPGPLAYFELTPVLPRRTHPPTALTHQRSPEVPPPTPRSGTWSLGPGSSLCNPTTRHNPAFHRTLNSSVGPLKNANSHLAWSVGLTQPDVYFSLIWNPRGRESVREESARGMTGGRGGGLLGVAQSRHVRAFPGNRASVPCNRGRGPERQWNVPMHSGRWGRNRRSNPFRPVGRSSSKCILGIERRPLQALQLPGTQGFDFPCLDSLGFPIHAFGFAAEHEVLGPHGAVGDGLGKSILRYAG